MGSLHDLHTFTIITTAANAVVRLVHDRVPLILIEAQIDAWLDPDNPDPAGVFAAVSSERLELVSVTPYANNARNDDPECLRPAQRGATVHAPWQHRHRCFFSFTRSCLSLYASSDPCAEGAWCSPLPARTCAALPLLSG